MEVTEDKCGILWERWLTPNGDSLILFATPSWYDVFVPLTNGVRHIDVASAIDAFVKTARKVPA